MRVLILKLSCRQVLFFWRSFLLSLASRPCSLKAPSKSAVAVLEMRIDVVPLHSRHISLVWGVLLHDVVKPLDQHWRWPICLQHWTSMLSAFLFWVSVLSCFCLCEYVNCLVFTLASAGIHSPSQKWVLVWLYLVWNCELFSLFRAGLVFVEGFCSWQHFKSKWKCFLRRTQLSKRFAMASP